MANMLKLHKVILAIAFILLPFGLLIGCGNKDKSIINTIRFGTYDEFIASINRAKDINLVDPHTDLNPLMCASLEGQESIVQELIKRGANIDYTNRIGDTALLDAAINGHYRIVKLLLAHGANANHSDSLTCSTALHLAVRSPNTVRILIKHGANIEARNDLGRTPLVQAAFGGDYVSVQILLDNGANVNAFQNNDYSALMFAALMGDEEIVNLLLSKGANPNLKSKTGDTALSIAENLGASNIVQILKAASNR